MSTVVRGWGLCLGLLLVGCVSPRATLPDGGGGGSTGGTGGKDGGAGGTGGGGQDVPADKPTDLGGADSVDMMVGPEQVTVTLRRSGNGTITGVGVTCSNESCAVTVTVGSNLELQANPAADSTFNSWAGCTSSTGATCTLTNIVAATQVTATFALKNANVIVAKDGDGAGTVTASWAGGGMLNCGTNCSAVIPKDTLVTFQAMPAAGSTFQWGAPCSGSAACMVTAGTQETTLRVTFTLSKVPLTVQRTGNGSVTGTGGISCTDASCALQVSYGSSVTLTAVPAANADFKMWTGCTSSSGTSCTVGDIKAATQVSVVFAPKKIAVTIQHSGNGKVITGDGMVNCTAPSCVVMADAGSTLALQAVPDADSTFTSWSGCTSVTGDTCTLSAIAAPVQVSATFALKNASLSIAKTGNGAGSVDATWAGGGHVNCGATCSAAVQPGTQVTLTATAMPGSTVAFGAPCSGSGPCMVTVAAGGTMVTVTFTLKKISVAVMLDGPLNSGSVSGAAAGINCGSTCSGLVDYGTSVALTATASNSGVFKSWADCPSVAGNVCTVVATADTTVTARFLTKNGGPCGGVAECSSGNCVGGVCCNTACAGECNKTCQTGTCQAQPARTACGSIAGPSGTGIDVAKICDGQGTCMVPKIQCPIGGGRVSCDLNTNACCYRGGDRDETCAVKNPGTTNCTFFGQNCAGTADCPMGKFCCQQSLPSGFNWAVCSDAAACTAQQYCDPLAASPGCLQGSCGAVGLCQ